MNPFQRKIQEFDRGAVAVRDPVVYEGIYEKVTTKNLFGFTREGDQLPPLPSLPPLPGSAVASVGDIHT